MTSDRRRSVPFSSLAVLFVPLSFGLMGLSGCGSSSNGTLVGASDQKGTGGRAAGGASGESGEVGFFKDAGASLQDSGAGVIPLDAACGESTIVATPKKVNILLVIDESGSMADKPTGFTVDKWSALKTAVGGALSAVKNDMAFGLELFPYPADPTKPIGLHCGGATGTSCCEMPAGSGMNIPVESGATSVPKIISALDGTAPGGGTPTALALGNALAYFQSGGGSQLEGDRYVLLATDGGPDCNAELTCAAAQCTTNLDGECGAPVPAGTNCCDEAFGGTEAKGRCLDDVATKAQIAALAVKGVKTFVVGIPGTEAYQASLDGFAEAGGETNPAGSPKYFAVTTAGGATGLGEVLASITQGLVTTCNLALTSDPRRHDYLNVYVDDKLVPAGPEGWHLDEGTTPPTVVLDGSTCEKVKAEGAERVRVIYGCTPTIR